MISIGELIFIFYFQGSDSMVNAVIFYSIAPQKINLFYLSETINSFIDIHQQPDF